MERVSEPLRVWIDQDLCTGDGLCVQYAPEVFEFDVDGLAYVKNEDGDLSPGHSLAESMTSRRSRSGTSASARLAASRSPSSFLT